MAKLYKTNKIHCKIVTKVSLFHSRKSQGVEYLKRDPLKKTPKILVIMWELQYLKK